MKNRKQIDVWFGRMMIAALGLTPAASEVGAITLAMSGNHWPLGSVFVPSHLNR
jgi:hypothetical protein